MKAAEDAAMAASHNSRYAIAIFGMVAVLTGYSRAHGSTLGAKIADIGGPEETVLRASVGRSDVSSMIGSRNPAFSERTEVAFDQFVGPIPWGPLLEAPATLKAACVVFYVPNGGSDLHQKDHDTTVGILLNTEPTGFPNPPTTGDLGDGNTWRQGTTQPEPPGTWPIHLEGTTITEDMLPNLFANVFYKTTGNNNFHFDLHVRLEWSNGDINRIVVNGIILPQGCTLLRACFYRVPPPFKGYPLDGTSPSAPDSWGGLSQPCSMAS